MEVKKIGGFLVFDVNFEGFHLPHRLVLLRAVGAAHPEHSLQARGHHSLFIELRRQRSVAMAALHQHRPPRKK